MTHGDWCEAHGCLRLSCTLQGRHSIGEPVDEDDDPIGSDMSGDEDWEAVMAMSHGELVAELTAKGVDVQAFVERVKERIAKTLAEFDRSGSSAIPSGITVDEKGAKTP